MQEVDGIGQPNEVQMLSALDMLDPTTPTTLVGGPLAPEADDKGVRWWPR
jgi:hypothetical protein